MIASLIERTNTSAFYYDSDLKFISLNRKPNNDCEFLFSINQIDQDIPVEYEEWKITCKNVKDIKGFNDELLLPYVKMALVESHPLLWFKNENHIECHIEGIPQNTSNFLGDLHLSLEENTGNWITIKDFFWSVNDRFSRSNGTTIIIPQSLLSIIKPVFEQHQLKLTVKNENCYNRDTEPLTKLLIFGNSDVSPNQFNLGQNFIIAEDFKAERVK